MSFWASSKELTRRREGRFSFAALDVCVLARVVGTRGIERLETHVSGMPWAERSGHRVGVELAGTSKVCSADANANTGTSPTPLPAHAPRAQPPNHHHHHHRDGAVDVYGTCCAGGCGACVYVCVKTNVVMGW